MKKLSLLLLIAIVFSLVIPVSVSAQSYYFAVDSTSVDVYYTSTGSMDVVYVYRFSNPQGSHVIDYVDIGLPNSNFSLSDVTADVNGSPLSDINNADPDYLNGTNSGVTIGLGQYAIQPGQSGTFTLRVNNIRKVMFTYNKGDVSNYASVRFVPNYFGSAYVSGTTNLKVTFHLPAGIKPEEPRWEPAPASWPGNSEPLTGYDAEGRVTYIWESSNADSSTKYEFAAAFPVTYVPSSEVSNPVLFTVDPGMLICGCVSLFFIAIIGFSFYSAIWGAKKRKMQYLPPKMSIEGHGIKRGLTAVEAAIIMEQPMDKILTMILFGVIKKNAVSVKTKAPLVVDIPPTLPEGLQPYETEFLAAFKFPDGIERQRGMQEVIVGLVKTVAEKMKGFSRKETVAYYDDINKRAWVQVEAAGTPEIKSQKFDENLEWTMLDKDYDGHMKQTFNQTPVILPQWWGRFDPTFHGGTVSQVPNVSMAKPSGSGSSQPTSVSMPSLPGASFASSMVTDIQTFASGVVGNITSFTSGVTNKTNPPPPPTTYRSGGGGSSGGRSCACACACAGCACACAGGGR